MRFVFDGNPNEPYYFPNSKELLVYPVAQYTQWLVANSFQLEYWGPQALQKVLASQSLNPGRIPTAPVPTATQVYQAQVKYLPFTTGQGVRLVTSYAQDAGPISNENIYYLYQGLSTDGQYWISFSYPIDAAGIPATGAEANQAAGDYTTFAQNYGQYIASFSATLTSKPADAFTPSLDQLDALVTSLTINSVVTF